MLKNIFVSVVGKFLLICYNLFIAYRKKQITSKCKGLTLTYPFLIRGLKNIQIESPVSIGPGATIYTTGAKLVIKKHCIFGPNLTIITGDHMYKPERWIDSFTQKEKGNAYDSDVVIEEDVWVGANVTILKGVTVGKSSIVAAGSLVIKDVPPFSIVGGVPACVIKRKWSEEDIERHKKFLERNNT